MRIGVWLFAFSELVGFCFVPHLFPLSLVNPLIIYALSTRGDSFFFTSLAHPSHPRSA